MSQRGSNNLPAVPRATGFARSLEDARAGQRMLVEESGNVVGRWSPAGIRASIKLAALMGGAVSLLVVLGSLIGVNVMLVVGLFPIPLLLWTARLSGLGRATRKLANDDLAGAEQEARALASAGPLVPRGVKGNAMLIAGAAAWLQGKLSQALELTRQAAALTPTAGAYKPIAVLARLNEIQLMAILGQCGPARAKLAELDAEGLPPGDLVQMQALDTRLVLAFEEDDPSTLPTDLDDWVRRVLATNRFGTTLVLLAWALRLRGNEDMVDMLFEVAVDRLPECHIDAAHPRLARWYRTQVPAPVDDDGFAVAD